MIWPISYDKLGELRIYLFLKAVNFCRIAQVMTAKMRNLTKVLCTEVQTPRNQEMTKIMSPIRIKSQNSHSWAVNGMIEIDLIESDGLKSNVQFHD